MDIRALLPHVLLLFGVGFLIANLRAGLDLRAVSGGADARRC